MSGKNRECWGLAQENNERYRYEQRDVATMTGKEKARCRFYASYSFIENAPRRAEHRVARREELRQAEHGVAEALELVKHA